MNPILSGGRKGPRTEDFNCSVSPRRERQPNTFVASLLLFAASSVASAGVTYEAGPLAFSTTGQSMWGSGGATVLQDSVFVGTEWTNKSTGIGGFTGSVSTVKVNTNPLWWTWKACDATGAPSWVCGSEPSKGQIKEVVDTRTGARLDLTSSGKFGLEFGYTIDSGSVDAAADFSAKAILPGTNPNQGEFFSLNPSSALEDGSISSQSPKAEAYINAIAKLSGSVTAKACLIAFGCTPEGVASLPTLDAKQPILSIDPNSLKVVPELLPGPTPADPRQALAEVKILNQTLTLEGVLAATAPTPTPGFKVTTNFGGTTLGSTPLPPGVPTVNFDLASIEAKLPNIATAGGLNGGSIKSSGRDDVIKARIDLDGVATINGFPPLGIGVDLIDSGGFKISARFDALDIDAGPDIGITQDFELNPTLMTRLDFNKPVMIAGMSGLQNFWQGAWDMIPDIALLETTTVNPTFWLEAMLNNVIGIDLGLTGTMDILKFTFGASYKGVNIIGTNPVSLNSLLGLGNQLFSTSKLRFPVYGHNTPAFMLAGFSPIQAAAFTINVPTPGTLVVLSIGLLAAGTARRRKRPPQSLGALAA